MNTVSCTVPFNTLKRRPHVSNPIWSSATILDDDTELITRRIVSVIEPEKENAIQFVKDAVHDKHPDTFPEWQMIEELFLKIRALPGSAYAFRYLLQKAEGYRREARAWWSGLISCVDVLEIKEYGMCKFLADRALEELDEYEAKAKDAYRPADTCRAYGIALQYATEELGSFAARKAIARLMLATPLPWEEAINPDWVDPYTSEMDGDYTYLRVKESADVSSDGNLPVMVQDLLDNLSFSEREGFKDQLRQMGQTLDDYWLQFKEAQRSGYVNLPEPEDEWEEPEFDVIEKDFQFSEDLKVTEAAEKAKALMALTAENGTEINLLAGVRAASSEMYEASAAAREAGEKFDWDGAHHKFLNDPRTRAFLRQFQALVWKFPIPDMMSILLPFQHTFGFWECDLYAIKVGATFRTMAHWFAINGEEYLEQFVNREDVDYGDPEINKKYARKPVSQEEPTPTELDEFAWRTLWLQNELYQDSEKRREEFAKVKGWRYRQDAKWHSAFVYAELQTAIMGEGGTQSAQAAGWNAWREALDKEANDAYKWERHRGATHVAAMAKFWEIVKRNRDKIASINDRGLKLRSGRQIDWHITLLKLKANEIPLEYNDRLRLRNLLRDKGWAPQVVKLLTDWLAKNNELAVSTL